MKLKNQNKYLIMEMLRAQEKAIKLKCYDCVCQMKGFDCKEQDCSLYPFRPWSKSISQSYKTIKNLNKDKYGK